MKIVLKMFGPCSSKLAFVKALKDLTGLSLKEAKDIADILFEEHRVRGSSFKVISLNGSYHDNSFKIEEFKNSLSPDAFEVSDTEHERNRKLLVLGLASEYEYLEGIAEELAMLSYNKSFESMKIELINALSCVGKTQLEEIYSQLFKSIYKTK